MPNSDQRGQATLEIAFVIPVLLGFILGAVDVSTLLRTQSALNEAAKLGARCIYPTDAACVNHTPAQATKLYGWDKIVGDPGVLVPKRDYSASARGLYGPTELYDNFIAFSLDTVDFTVNQTYYDASTLHYPATAFKDHWLMEKNGLPFMQIKDAYNPNLIDRDNIEFYEVDPVSGERRTYKADLKWVPTSSKSNCGDESSGRLCVDFNKRVQKFTIPVGVITAPIPEPGSNILAAECLTSTPHFISTNNWEYLPSSTACSALSYNPIVDPASGHTFIAIQVTGNSKNTRSDSGASASMRILNNNRDLGGRTYYGDENFDFVPRGLNPEALKGLRDDQDNLVNAFYCAVEPCNPNKCKKAYACEVDTHKSIKVPLGKMIEIEFTLELSVNNEPPPDPDAGDNDSDDKAEYWIEAIKIYHPGYIQRSERGACPNGNQRNNNPSATNCGAFSDSINLPALTLFGSESVSVDSSVDPEIRPYKDLCSSSLQEYQDWKASLGPDPSIEPNLSSYDIVTTYDEGPSCLNITRNGYSCASNFGVQSDLHNTAQVVVESDAFCGKSYIINSSGLNLRSDSDISISKYQEKENIYPQSPPFEWQKADCADSVTALLADFPAPISSYPATKVTAIPTPAQRIIDTQHEDPLTYKPNTPAYNCTAFTIPQPDRTIDNVGATQLDGWKLDLGEDFAIDVESELRALNLVDELEYVSVQRSGEDLEYHCNTPCPCDPSSINNCSCSIGNQCNLSTQQLGTYPAGVVPSECLAEDDLIPNCESKYLGIDPNSITVADSALASDAIDPTINAAEVLAKTDLTYTLPRARFNCSGAHCASVDVDLTPDQNEVVASTSYEVPLILLAGNTISITSQTKKKLEKSWAK